MTEPHPGEPLRHRSTQVLLDRLIRECVRPYRDWLVVAIALMAVVAAATALSAWLMEPVVNEVFIEKDREALWLVSGAVVATFAIKGLANYGQTSMMAKVGLKIVADTQNRLFAHLARMDLAFFHANATGKLVSRFVYDVGTLRTAVSDGLTSLGKDLMSLIGLVAVMFIQDWELAAVAFFAFPAAVYPILRLGRRIRKVSANTQHEMGQFTTLLDQTFDGIRVVKSYGMEDYEQGRVAGLVDRLYRLTLKAARIRALNRPIMETLAGLAVAVVIVYGGHRVIAESLDTGSFFSFITALLMAYEPMKRLANLNATLQQGLAASDRLFDLLDTEPDIRDAADARGLVLVGGGIRFEGVSFAYEPDKPALAEIDVVVPPGGRVALVGPSGAGKTTILNLILRFYDPDAGRILIDGQDVRGLARASLHAHVALVSQDIVLFDDTVRANVAYGRPGAGDDEIRAAARNAAAEDFIDRLPAGFDTPVGERGVKLSGGERQRLAIARAMLKNAPILLLDEATSALDSDSERQVQAALDELMRGRTTLLIAHRLSTVIDADRIYVMDQGRVVEEGTHAELLARGGVYSRLSALQSVDEDAPRSVARVAGA